MELVDENEGYYDEEDGANEVVDFLAGESLPTFSFKPKSQQKSSQNNDRNKFYADEDSQAPSNVLQIPTTSLNLQNSNLEQKPQKSERFQVVNQFLQVYNDPYAEEQTRNNTTETEDDSFCLPIQCMEEEPEVKSLSIQRTKQFQTDEVRKGLQIDKAQKQHQNQNESGPDKSLDVNPMQSVANDSLFKQIKKLEVPKELLQFNRNYGEITEPSSQFTAGIHTRWVQIDALKPVLRPTKPKKNNQKAPDIRLQMMIDRILENMKHNHEASVKQWEHQNEFDLRVLDLNEFVPLITHDQPPQKQQKIVFLKKTSVILNKALISQSTTAQVGQTTSFQQQQPKRIVKLKRVNNTASQS